MDFTFVPVSAFVQADSQQPNPNANGIFVAPAGAGFVAWSVPIGPVTSGSITANINATQTIILSAVSGTTLGVNWTLALGQTVVLEPNTPNQEAFVITGLPGSNQVQGVIRKNHTANPVIGGIAATAFFLDQARSAMDPDGQSPQGSAQVQTSSIDPTSGKLYGARAATADSQPATNATIVATGLLNPAGAVDRLRTLGAGRLDTSDQDILAQILIELRTITLVLAEGLSTNTDPDDYRATVQLDYPLQ